MRVKDAAVKLEVSIATVYSLVAAGRLRCCRVGMGRGAIRISEEQMAEYLKGAERVVDTMPAPAAPTPPRYRPKHVRID